MISFENNQRTWFQILKEFMFIVEFLKVLGGELRKLGKN